MSRDVTKVNIILMCFPPEGIPRKPEQLTKEGVAIGDIAEALAPILKHGQGILKMGGVITIAIGARAVEIAEVRAVPGAPDGGAI